MFRAISLVLLVVCCSLRAAPDGRTDKLIMKIAEGQLDAIATRIMGHEEDYGFATTDNLEKCTIGKPYRIITFNDEFYTTAQPIESINYIDIKNEWRVPLILEDQYRSLLTVDGNPGNLTVSGIGDTALARQLQHASGGSSEEDAFYILRVPVLHADFFASEKENSFSDAKFIPLASAIEAIPSLEKSKKDAFTLDEVQEMVKDAIKNKAQKKDSLKKEPVKKKVKTKSKRK